ncbi:MAG: LysM peptidoglycan-binding domain-containing protein [Muribaculaceae bacterium]|nr:LysM peptidoglycan-binding domain-containing protein [Muribaculaceae bacterium]
MNRLSFFRSCAAVCLALAALAPADAQKKKNVLDIKESITDDNIIYPEANFEAESRKMLEGWYMQNYMATDDRYATKEDVNTSDATYRQRLADLPTIIEMPFNQVVKSHIERYTKRGRPMVASLLGLGNYYMPIFEQALEEAGLPLELKYLPVIESGLDPNAVSKAGATGLWQFMMISAKGLNMEVNSLVDERRDPYVSSQRAAKFLKDLYKTYGDWSLAIAAYNCGPGNVNKALRRAGGDPSKLDFWAIYDYLPSETRGYVPAFIAANYVMNYYQNHNISPVIPKRPLVTDTLHINRRVHFNQISEVLDIPIEELRMLNPQFRNDVIPGTASKSYNLILPSQQVHAYIMSENEILGHDAEKYARRTDATPGKYSGSAATAELPGDDENSPEDYIAAVESDQTDVYEEMREAPTMNRKPENTTPVTSRRESVAAESNSTRTIGPADTKTKTHKVEPGESLASIAAKYGVGPEDIKTWNNLRRNSVRTGQVLRIAGNTSAKADTPKTPEVKTERTANKKAETTTNVKKNETVVASKPTPAKKAEPAAPVKKNEPSSYKKKAGQDDQAQAGKKSKANTKEAVANAKKGSAESDNGKKKGKKTVEPAQPKEHTVVNGESYDRIARKYGISTEELKKANNAKDDKIHPNQKLKIPAKKAGGKDAAPAKDTKGSKNAAAATPAKGKSNEHTVVSGESYDRIARKYGITTEELKKANNAKDDRLQPNQKLKIPKKSNTKKK